MDNPAAPRESKAGGIFVIVVIVGSALGVGIWHLWANRNAPAFDSGGFDLALDTQKKQAPMSNNRTQQNVDAPSSLQMLKIDSGVSIVDSATNESAKSNSTSASGTPEQQKESAHKSFTQEARTHEQDVRHFAERMTAKYPIIRQYGRDWMSYPDLKKLNDDYMRNHDPIAFLVGLAKSPNVGSMVKKYAGRPEIREFIVEGVKQAPKALTASAMDVLSNDGLVKNLISNIVSGIGLPPSLTAMINGSDPSKIDQNKMMNEMMKSPEMQKALQQAQQQPPPVGQ